MKHDTLNLALNATEQATGEVQLLSDVLDTRVEETGVERRKLVGNARFGADLGGA